MNYNIKVSPDVKSTTLANIPDGSLAIVTGENEFAGELFYKNVAGLHSISRNRYWPRDREYVSPINASCRLIGPGDILKIEEAK